MHYFSGKAIKKDAGFSKTSTEVKKPTGVKIKSEAETSKPKVHHLHFKFLFDPYLKQSNLTRYFIFRAGKGTQALTLCLLLQRGRSKPLSWTQK
jgi:hypothetical protein